MSLRKPRGDENRHTSRAAVPDSPAGGIFLDPPEPGRIIGVRILDPTRRDRKRCPRIHWVLAHPLLLEGCAARHREAPFPPKCWSRHDGLMTGGADVGRK